VAVCDDNSRRLFLFSLLTASDVAVCLVLALVISRLDCRNSVYARLPSSMTAIHQHVQNVAACMVIQLRPRDHVTPALLQLH
jgi:hypothetical protein